MPFVPDRQSVIGHSFVSLHSVDFIRAVGDAGAMAQDDPPEDSDKNTEWAELRTDLAEDRNIMALERTFAGWMRTAFAAIGIGLGFKAVFGAFDPPWLAKAIATLFILSGGWLAVTAERRACHTLRQLKAHKFEAISTPNFRTVAYSVAIGSVILVAGLWILNDGNLNGAG